MSLSLKCLSQINGNVILLFGFDIRDDTSKTVTLDLIFTIPQIQHLRYPMVLLKSENINKLVRCL